MDIHVNADSLVRNRWYVGSGARAVLAVRDWSKKMKKLAEERDSWRRTLGADALGTASDDHGVPHYGMLVWKKRPDIVPPGCGDPFYAEPEDVWIAFPMSDEAGQEIVRRFQRYDPLDSSSRLMLETLGVEGEIRLPDGSRRRPVAMPLAALGKVSLVVPDDGRRHPEAPKAPDWMDEVGRDEFEALQKENEAGVRQAAQAG